MNKELLKRVFSFLVYTGECISIDRIENILEETQQLYEELHKEDIEIAEYFYALILNHLSHL